MSALHVQWVRRFVSSPSSWVSVMVFWFSSLLAAPPHAVFPAPDAFADDFLPPFYRSLLLAWRACKGSFHVSTLGIGSGIEFRPVLSMTSKSTYLLLLSENAVPVLPSFWFSLLVLDLASALFLRFGSPCH